MILRLIHWYVAYSLSYRDVEELALERGLTMDHSTMRGFKAFHSAEATLAGIELHHMLKKVSINKLAI